MAVLRTILHIVIPILLLLGSFPASSTSQRIDDASCQAFGALGDKRDDLRTAITEAFTIASRAVTDLFDQFPNDEPKNNRAVQALFGVPGVNHQAQLPVALPKYQTYANFPNRPSTPLFICGDFHLTKVTDPATGVVTIEDRFGIAPGDPPVVFPFTNNQGPICDIAPGIEAETFTYTRPDVGTIIVICPGLFSDPTISLTVGDNRFRNDDRATLIAAGGGSINFWRQKFISMNVLHELAHALLSFPGFRVIDQPLTTTIPGDLGFAGYLYDGAVALVNQGDSAKSGLNADSYTMLLMIVAFESTDFADGVARVPVP